MAGLADLFAAAIARAHPRPLTHAEQMERGPQPLPSWLTDNPLPPGWQNPRDQTAEFLRQMQQPPPPVGPDHNWYDPQAHPAPNIHVPPGKELKKRGLVL